MRKSPSRFIALDKPIEDYVQEQQNKNTRAKTRRDVSLPSEFVKQKKETRELEEIKPDELDKYLCEFILSVKRKDRSTMNQAFEGSFQVLTVLKEGKYPVLSIIDDKEFDEARKCLEARSEQLS